MTPIFVVLDTHDDIARLKEASKYYAEPRPLMVPKTVMAPDAKGVMRPCTDDVEELVDAITPLDTPRAKLILSALYQEVLSQTLAYRKHQCPLETITRALRDCAVPTRSDRALAEDFLSQPAVDGLVIDLNLAVQKIIGDDHWRQWDFIETPYVMGMLGGKDYRIAEWEREHHTREENEVLEVDVGPVIAYIAEQLRRRSIDVVGLNIDLMFVIADALARRYPMMEFDFGNRAHGTDALYQAIQSQLHMDYETFYHQFVKEVFEAFQIYFFLARLDAGIAYQTKLKGTSTLVFCAQQPPRDTEERYFHDLKQSLERGDWVPESERRRLAEWERDNPF